MRKIGIHQFHPHKIIRFFANRLGRAQVHAQLKRFNTLKLSLSKRADLIFDDSISDVIILTPRRESSLHKGKKRIGLTFLAMVHGDEIAGAAVLNGLLAKLESGELPVDIPLAFVLGNPAAARRNVRCLQRDLNRSFGIAVGNHLEEKRARELSVLLRDTDFLIDFHQTTQATDQPFFIFPFEKRSFDFARAIAPEWTIVTHRDTPSAGEQFSSDGFVQQCGGVGVTVELGKKAMSARQIASGVKCGLAAYRAVTEGFGVGAGTGPVYTWSEKIPWPSGSFVETVKGLKNFTPITQGKKLAEVNGRIVQAPHDGLILFPRYLTRQQQRSYRPLELCRILKPFDSSRATIFQIPERGEL